MYYKIITSLILLITFILTIGISIVKPSMHKKVFVYNSEYKIVSPQEPVFEQTEIPTIEQKISEPITETKTQKQVQVEEKIFAPVTKSQTKVVSTPVVNNQKVVKKVVSAPISTPKIVSKTVKTPDNVNHIIDKYKNQAYTKEETTSAQKTESPKIEQKASKPEQQVKTAQKPNTIQVQPKTTPIPVVKKEEPKLRTLTAQQEEIEWNKWRSRLQNQIMNDVHMPAVAQGTIFRFSFDVDKYGKITNIQTSSDTRSYTPYAVQFIAPVIRRYQGRSILNFPAGSQRTATKFVGAWKISTQSRYSTPNDYNDTEKVVR